MKTFKVFCLLALGVIMYSCQKDTPSNSTTEYEMNEAVTSVRTSTSFCLPGNCDLGGKQFGFGGPKFGRTVTQVHCFDMDAEGCISLEELEIAFEEKSEEIRESYTNPTGPQICRVTGILGDDGYCSCDGPSVCINFIIWLDCIDVNDGGPIG